MADLKRTKIDGGLVIENGNASLLNNDVDASAVDNGVSTISYPSLFNMVDKQSRVINRLECIPNPNGNIESVWYVRNYNTSGTMVGQKGLKMSMDKTGNLSYGIGDPVNFRSALGLGDSSTRGVKTASTATHSGYGTNNDYVPDIGFISYWNGAYNQTGASNLAYCTKGAFGNVCTLTYEQVDSW